MHWDQPVSEWLNPAGTQGARAAPLKCFLFDAETITCPIAHSQG